MPGTPIQGIAPSVAWVDVCNGALKAVGARRISSLTDGSPSQIACSDALLDAITSVIAANDDWCVLRKRAQLAVDATYTPPNDYLYAYALPADCSDFVADGVEAIDAPAPLQPVQLPPGRKSSHLWSREDRWLLTDATLVYLQYQRTLDNEDAQTLPKWFTNAIKDELAVQLCMPMRQNVGLLGRLEARAMKSVAQAIATDDKMKETFEGSKTRGYGYYEETRGTGTPGIQDSFGTE